jgi:hypothetical protein
MRQAAQQAYQRMTALKSMTGGSRLSVPHHRTFLPPFPLPLPLLSHAIEPPSKGRPCGHTRRRGWHQRVPRRNPPSTSTTTTYIEGSAQSLANRGLSSPFPLSVMSGGGEAEEKEAGSCPRERHPPRRPEPPVRRSQTADAAHAYIPCFLCSVSPSSSESMTPLCPFSPTPTRQPVATEVRACSPAHLLRSRPSSRGENTMSIVVAAAAVHAVV